MVWKTFRQYQKNSLPTAGKPGREVETSSTKLPHQDVEKRRRLRRQPKRAQLRLAVDLGRNCRRLPPCDLDHHEGLFLPFSGIHYPLSCSWTFGWIVLLHDHEPRHTHREAYRCAAERAAVARPATSRRARQVRCSPPPSSKAVPASLRASEQGQKAIEREVISSYQVAQSLGFNGDFRAWEHLLRIHE